MTAEDLIQKLGLKVHPEGGYFKEVYRSEELIPSKSLPDRYGGDRSFSTSIYYLLAGNQKSFFHCLKSDEIWHYYYGSPLLLHILHSNNSYQKVIVGNNFSKDEVVQYTVPRGSWFAAESADKNSFSLIGATVVPGFDFNDFELGRRADLLKKFPDHEVLILNFTKEV